MPRRGARGRADGRSTNIGPVIDAGGREKVEHRGDEAVQRVAKLVSGGDR
jgi:acyl-CoA reductase-like NAD-dependent aldehyde dehydrogenase